MSLRSTLTILIILVLGLSGCQIPALTATPPAASTDTPLPAPTDTPIPTSTYTPAPTETAVPSATPTWVWVEPTQPPTVTAMPPLALDNPAVDTLRTLADVRNLTIGAAVNNGLVQETEYAEVLVSQFNLITTENAMKFGMIHPEPGVYDFAPADEIVNFALANGMAVRGHTLVWHNQMPDWLRYGEQTPDQVREILYQHIHTVVGRYRGQVAMWDVVNEGVNGAGGIARTYWYDQLGEEYIDLAFQWAHEADPDALLFYNDYNAEGVNNKSDGIYKLVKGMLERGVPIHGVGMQFHFTAGAGYHMDSIAKNMQRLGELGLQVHITELDVHVPENPSDADLQAQAETYRKVLETCLAEPNCTAFITWGFTDKYSWIPQSKPGRGAALLFDEAYQPKPAFFALIETFLASK